MNDDHFVSMNDDHLVFDATARPEPCECIADGLEDNQALLEQFSFSESDPLPNQHLLIDFVVIPFYGPAPPADSVGFLLLDRRRHG